MRRREDLKQEPSIRNPWDLGSERQEGEQKSQDTEARLPPELDANIGLELGISNYCHNSSPVTWLGIER
jgi:hypothetical protein